MTSIIIYLFIKPSIRRLKFVPLILCLFFGITGNLITKYFLPSTNDTFTLNYNFHRYHMITCSLSWPYLQNIYPNLPQYIKNTLPIEEVTKYDTQANYFYQIRTYIDPLGKEVYKDIIRTILKNDWMSICYRYPMGILHYSLSPLYLYYNFKGTKEQGFSDIPLSWFYRIQDWTYTRMEMYAKNTTLYYWQIAWCIFILSLLILSFLLLKRKNIFLQKESAIFFAITPLSTAIIFSCNNPIFIHLRYTVTWYTSFFILLMCLVIPNIYSKNNSEIEK
ncbi:hypothetical protein [Lawsonia intracellularis]|nr:hypothetical protein [Lawsonia intracellularis]UYH53730.1 hypothetical protein OCT60_07305 [Lawsonia intracellularis]